MTSPYPLENLPALILNALEVAGQNPPPAGQETYLLTLFHGQHITVSLAQIQGTLKPHYHDTHDETIYVLKGRGQALVNGKWEGLSPGTVMYFQGKHVHASRAEAGNPLVFLCLFVPGMKEIDRVFVE